MLSRFSVDNGSGILVLAVVFSFFEELRLFVCLVGRKMGENEGN